MAARVDVYASHPHYVDHLKPVWDALPADRRGRFITTGQCPNGRRLTVVSAFGDLRSARNAGRSCVFMEHGAGFTFGNGHPSYAGATDRDGVTLFVSPNRFAARANEQAHPHIPQVIVGSPRLDRVWGRTRIRHTPPRVVVSFHWDCNILPETRSAFPHWANTVAWLPAYGRRDGYQPFGHYHPMNKAALTGWWNRFNVQIIDTFDEVLDTADLYVTDSSSTAYEAAAAGIPVLTLNAPWYRRHVNHGLRFWQHVPGLQADDPSQLRYGIVEALEDPKYARIWRQRAVEAAWPIRDGSSAQRAAQAIVDALP